MGSFVFVIYQKFDAVMAQVAAAASPSPGSASTVTARGSSGGNMGGFQPASSSQAAQQHRGNGSRCLPLLNSK
jgi:hypothetical protein